MTILDFAAPETENTELLKSVWQKINLNSCPHQYNFHMHTIYSDGQLKPEELMKQAIEIGLKGMAITDHHSTGGFEIAQNYLKDLAKKGKKSLPYLWSGVEITSRLKGVEVHILGYGFTPNHPAIQEYLENYCPKTNGALAKDVIHKIHLAGGLAVLAHPARYQRSASELIIEAVSIGIDGVETYYGYGNPKPWACSKKQTELVKTYAQKYNLFSTCGTDTHGLSLLFKI